MKAGTNSWQETDCHENQDFALHGKDIKQQQIHASNSEKFYIKLSRNFAKLNKRLETVP